MRAYGRTFLATKTIKNTQTQNSAKTRTSLFETVFTALDKLDTLLTSAKAERLTDSDLGSIAVITQLMASTVETIIVQHQVREISPMVKNKKKTPRPKARRKG